MHDSQRLFFYQTQDEACGYLSGQRARNLLADPYYPMDPELYQRLIEQGFRRSGAHVYRPYCINCDACVPVRIPVREFRPNRSQRRCLRDNQDIEVRARIGHFQPHYFALYQRYLASRHAGGGMDSPTQESFSRFLLADWCNTLFYEFWLDTQLVGVAVSDQLPNALSAVYTFFEPGLPGKRGLGKFAVLWQIEAAQHGDTEHLYLGYWIGNCEKMNYKTQYRPLEFFDGQSWQRH
jgi:arginine-tRNA-protein transferase